MFRFRLEPVLTMRKREERDAQIEVARLERERQRVRSGIEHAHAASRASDDELVGILGRGGVDLRSARLQANTSMRLRFDARRALGELDRLGEELSRARAALAQAAARRKGVELLKEKHRAAYEQAIKQRETRELDDTNNARAAMPRDSF